MLFAQFREQADTGIGAGEGVAVVELRVQSAFEGMQLQLQAFQALGEIVVLVRRDGLTGRDRHQ